MTDFQKVLSGRRVAIPQDLAKKYDIKEGDIVMVVDHISGSGIAIIPCDITPRRGKQRKEGVNSR